ncbi:hypothetical protein [Symbiopectobacterium purcellii]|uniref:Uncharacterized protein n=1 Tax=Symbiopectobacterium purcellii TaxID=2871826 RepID=A0ABX9AG53_9ENTR|nr:hypothetical protein [Symbiopectobacterium purcellii]QZN94142.1 hypothetical protein K6K13_12135 [Symbiopectobacterium purcellii]
MMQLNKPHITTFNQPDHRERGVITYGSNNINHPHYLMNTQIFPGDDSETKGYKLTIAYLTEENQWLKKQVKKLTGLYD